MISDHLLREKELAVIRAFVKSALLESVKISSVLNSGFACMVLIGKRHASRTRLAILGSADIWSLMIAILDQPYRFSTALKASPYGVSERPERETVEGYLLEFSSILSCWLLHNYVR